MHETRHQNFGRHILGGRVAPNVAIIAGGLHCNQQFVG